MVLAKAVTVERFSWVVVVVWWVSYTVVVWWLFGYHPPEGCYRSGEQLLFSFETVVLFLLFWW